MISTNIVALIALFVSLGALLISYFSFRRGNRMDNENHLFKMKLDIYSKLLGDLDRLSWYLNDSMIKFNKPKIYELTEADIDALADEVDEKIYEFGYKVSEYSLYFSDKIFDKVEDIFDLLYDQDEEMKIEEFKMIFNEILSKSNDLNELMREELQLETLNKSLFNRIKETRFSDYFKK